MGNPVDKCLCRGSPDGGLFVSGLAYQGIGWVQIPGPDTPFAIDTSNFRFGGPYVANIRADPYGIVIWNGDGSGGLNVNIWALGGIRGLTGNGWLGLADYPGFAGPVGPLLPPPRCR